MSNKQKITRRRVVLSTSAAITSVTGCLQSSDDSSTAPDLTVVETTRPNPIVDELSQSGSEYSATIENPGISGTILAELYFAENQSATPVLEKSKQLYLDSGEQSTVSFSAQRPDWVEGFKIEAYGIEYVADIRNTGAEGVVSAWIEDTATESEIKETEVTIPADTTKQVEFTTPHKFEGEYEVKLSLIDW